MSKAMYPQEGQAFGAVVASSEGFADALAAGPFAVRHDAPVLLTAHGSLDSRTAQELERAVPKSVTVFVLGGTAALGEAIDNGIRKLGFQTERIAGPDRFATAVEFAKKIDGGIPVLANGQDFPDAVVAGPVALLLAGSVLLTDGDKMPEVTKNYLRSHSLRFAIGDAAAAADPGANKIAGADRYGTSLVAARQFFGGKTSGPLGTGSGNDPSTVGVTTGMNWPDALAAAPYLAKFGGGPILLTIPNRLSEGAATYIGDMSRAITTAAIFGGEEAVTSAVKARVDSELIARCGP